MVDFVEYRTILKKKFEKKVKVTDSSSRKISHYYDVFFQDLLHIPYPFQIIYRLTALLSSIYIYGKVTLGGSG